jgi:tetratricopeptide (TPR) repeat protein
MGAVRRDMLLFGTTPAHARRIDAVANNPAFARNRAYLAVARAYATAGRPDRARAMLARYETEVRDTTTRRADRAQLDLTLAEIALTENRIAEAVAAFRRGDSLPDGPATACYPCLPANLARTYDRANQPDSAIAALEAFLQVEAVPVRSFIAAEGGVFVLVAPFEKRLGELYEQRGDRQKAYTHYARFVELWKNADPELQPRVAEVRRRMARLKDVERR